MMSPPAPKPEMCLEKECEPGTGLNTDTASGEPTAKNAARLGRGFGGRGRAEVGRRWFSASVFTCHHQSIHQPKDPH